MKYFSDGNPRTLEELKKVLPDLVLPEGREFIHAWENEETHRLYVTFRGVTPKYEYDLFVYEESIKGLEYCYGE